MRIEMTPRGMEALSAYLGFHVDQHENLSYEDTHVVMAVDDLEKFLTFVEDVVTECVKLKGESLWTNKIFLLTSPSVPGRILPSSLSLHPVI